jgi:hypothetical protein
LGIEDRLRKLEEKIPPSVPEYGPACGKYLWKIYMINRLGDEPFCEDGSELPCETCLRLRAELPDPSGHPDMVRSVTIVRWTPEEYEAAGRPDLAERARLEEAYASEE